MRVLRSITGVMFTGLIVILAGIYVHTEARTVASGTDGAAPRGKVVWVSVSIPLFAQASTTSGRVAMLYVAAPLVSITTRSGWMQARLDGWARPGGTIVYVDTGTIGSAIKGAAVSAVPRPLATATNTDTGVTWNKVELRGWLPAGATVTSSAILWTTAQALYTRNCGVCHALHAPDQFTSTQWPANIKPMGPRTSLTAAQIDLVLKYLQWHASDLARKHGP